MIKDIKEGEESAIRALELLHSHPIGQAVLLNLRNHSEPSKGAVKMIGDLNKRINSLIITFFILVIGSVGANWVMFEKSFEGHEANLTTKIDLSINKSEEALRNSNENNKEIKEIKEVLTKFLIK